ncbi:PfkB family carbohydrate kinase [Jatrophihabitans lederbergiae]|uniref:PfkB family carbohydrate kinase n=1 Tax=Jatrophihabitans lederbergiae TaxID=3075547 RepID=A0ABU2JEJ0_9ACTN|nr:PfkB family carbohydrate kinase [Jatrophihabitans sp. DSM 44399]MDT0263417.1 PfkB family carbohydrate kinase [Jatrophihabitans sp. DSM 44399]
MIVVGGTYREVCVRPDWNYLAGSGLRAAAALSGRAATGIVTLHTAVDERMNEEAELVYDALGVTRAVIERDEPVEFRFFTPLSHPAVSGPNASMEDLNAEADTALVFGLIESGHRRVAADRIVLDPQQPRDLKPLKLDGLVADELIVVANSTEVRKLAGNIADPSEATKELLNQGVDAVVMKGGASGCDVTWLDGGELRFAHVGAHPTRSVWPVGSGDVFSAGFSYALHSGADIVQAARVASASAAHWCSTKVPAVPPAILRGELSGSGLPDPMPERPGPKARVYLAGPFFSTSELWLVDVVRRSLLALGVDVFSPVHDVGLGGLEVAEADLAGLAACSGVLALFDGADPGTIFEIGWAVKAGIPVVGFADRLDAEGTKMLEGSGVELHRDLSSAAYRSAWVAMGAAVVPGWVTK